jgi:hypothetical protein
MRLYSKMRHNIMITSLAVAMSWCRDLQRYMTLGVAYSHIEDILVATWI